MIDLLDPASPSWVIWWYFALLQFFKKRTLLDLSENLLFLLLWTLFYVIQSDLLINFLNIVATLSSGKSPDHIFTTFFRTFIFSIRQRLCINSFSPLPPFHGHPAYLLMTVHQMMELLLIFLTLSLQLVDLFKGSFEFKSQLMNFYLLVLLSAQLLLGFRLDWKLEVIGVSNFVHEMRVNFISHMRNGLNYIIGCTK